MAAPKSLVNSYLSLIQSNLETLQEGAALLDRLTPTQFTASQQPAFLATIGAHYRHLLEHYRCFLEQLHSAQICFDARARELKLERDLPYARRVMAQVIQELAALDTDSLNAAIMISDQQTCKPVQSSVARELLFLQAHSVHHYALIAAMARMQGVKTAPDFGVAVATKAFNDENNVAVG